MMRKIKLIPAWFKEYFAPCPSGKKYIDKEKLFIVCGHRGSPTKEPENTISSLALALKEGANSLEVDLCITADRQVVLWHDWDPYETNAILRESGFEPFVRYKPHPPGVGHKYRKPVNQVDLYHFRKYFRYKERNTGKIPKVEIPTLTDFFKWSKVHSRLKNVNFDLKTPADTPECAEAIVQILSDHIIEYNPRFSIVLETTYPAIYDLVKSKFPGMDIALDIEPPAGLVLDPAEYSAVEAAIKNNSSYAMALRPRKITIANWTTYRRIIRHDVALKHQFNSGNPVREVKRLIGGTVSKPREMRCLIKLGIDGIQTDFPAALAKMAVKMGRRIE